MNVRALAFAASALWSLSASGAAAVAPAVEAPPAKNSPRKTGEKPKAKPTRPAQVDRDKLLITLSDGRVIPSPLDLVSMGQDVDEALIALAIDVKQRARVRSRAIIALGQIGTRKARIFLRDVLATQGAKKNEADLVLLKNAILASALAVDGQSVNRLEALLQHPNPDVQIDAIAALCATRLPEALKVLQRFSQEAKNSHVQRKAKEQTQILQDALRESKRNAPKDRPPPAPRVIPVPGIGERTDPRRAPLP